MAACFYFAVKLVQVVSGKKEKIIDYISALPAGAKVSVRNLARDLNVSEGTAYKAIKYAEERKLVETKSRAGTVRLQQDVFSDARPTLLSDEIGRLGLCVLAGEEFADVPIGRLILGDGSLDQFKGCLLSAGENALCIVGDRPDLLFFAVSHGANVILTCGTQPGEALLATAREHGVCVLTSMQDGSTVLNYLRSGSSGGRQVSDSDMANRWMRTPPYLYYNDVVADWYSSYRPVFSMGSMCAVVDDNMHICGTVDAAGVLTASPSVKISSLYSTQGHVFTASEDTPMHEIAQRMISEECSVAYITRDQMLSGIVTANDVLRYYNYNPGAGSPEENLPILENISSSTQRSVYSVLLGSRKSSSTDVLLGIINAAARRYCNERFGKDCAFISGTFYSSVATTPCELMISCETTQTLSPGYALEVEMYSETASYARCVLVVAADGTDS